jgi:hypothetical protein
VETDVVPTFNYRRYDKNGGHVLGTRLRADEDGSFVNNFPKQHIENGKTKNYQTSKRFKRLTRVFRKIRYKMIDDKVPMSDSITSFLLECLIWNVPNSILNAHNTWQERLESSILHLYHQTSSDDKCKEWDEVSELLYLFHGERKWNRKDVNGFLVSMWNYLGYE